MSDVVWSVLPHGEIEEVAENLWRVEGALARGPLKRVMTVVKRSDGALLVHNAVALEEEGMKRLEGLGELAFLVVPNGYHRIDAPRFAARYPKMRVYCTKGARARVSEVVKVDGTLDELPADPAVEVLPIDGVGDAEAALAVRSKDGVTLILNDLVFNMPHAPGLGGFVLKHLTSSSGGPRISRIARLFLVKDRAAVRASLERLSETRDLLRVIVSHHETIDRDPRRVLRDVAATL